MRRDLAYLEDILIAAGKITEGLHGQTLEQFLSNWLLQSALAHQFAVIGEASTRVSLELRERHPAIPWAKAKGMRNVVVHNYFGIDWDEVWKTATEDIPILRA